MLSPWFWPTFHFQGELSILIKFHPPYTSRECILATLSAKEGRSWQVKWFLGNGILSYIVIEPCIALECFHAFRAPLHAPHSKERRSATRDSVGIHKGQNGDNFLHPRGNYYICIFHLSRCQMHFNLAPNGITPLGFTANLFQVT